jgi:hypothetical protein
MQNLIAAFKPNPKEMIYKIITGGLGKSSSGKDVYQTVQFQCKIRGKPTEYMTSNKRLTLINSL